MFRIKRLLIIFFFITLILPIVPVEASDTVQNVTVSLTSTEGPLPARVIKRMEASVATVGKHVFSGRDIRAIASSQESYERIVKDVIDRVLVGYSVQEVILRPGATSHIAVTVAPWGDVVRDVSLEVDFGSLSPDLITLVKKDMGTLQEDLAGVLVGLPVDAMDWAGGVSKAVIREILATQLPEFRSNFDIVSAPKTIVKLTLMPQSPVVQDTKITLRSRTVPNVLLVQARPAVEEAAKVMNGLPVAFVQRHSEYFNRQIASSVKAHPVARRYGLTLVPKVLAGSETIIELHAETEKYRLALEGYVDMGKKEDNTVLKLHAGKFLGPADELFTEVEFIPSSVTWQFYPGWSHKIGSTTFGGAKYNTSDQTAILWVNQYIGHDWTLRAERTTETGRSEIGVRYKIHDFLSAEYVFGDQDKWLRLIGHL